MPESSNAPMTELDRVRSEVLQNLERLGELTVSDDDLEFTGTRFVLPASMAGNVKGAVRYLLEYDEQQTATFEFNRTFDYRPWDGAAAFDRAMRKVFGTRGTGRTLKTFFGPIHPEYRSVAVGPGGESIQVPWGQIHLAPLEATFTIGGIRSKDKGMISYIAVETKKRYAKHVEAFFAVIEDELRTGSIYRGKAFTGGEEPEFLDTSAVDPREVVYSQDVVDQLDTELWAILRFSQAMRDHGQPLKRSVLVEGPYGTGKTLAGRLTAKVAAASGWTFVIARPGRDDITDVLATAQLYSPAVVWFEDVDVVAEGDSPENISRLLDTLDGIQTKGIEVVAVFTTNHVDKIHKGVLRPGRVDAVVHIGELDADGVQKLIRAKVPAASLAKNVDWSQVTAAYEGYLPAFVAEAAGRAFRRSMARNDGAPGTIDTDDLVYAANSLRAQHQMMLDAEEGKVRDTLADRLVEEMRRSIDKSEIRDDTDDLIGVVSVAKD